MIDSSHKALNAAPMATLNREPLSEEADLLTIKVLGAVLDHEIHTGARQRRRSSDDMGSIAALTSGFLGDLMHGKPQGGSGGYVYRSLYAKSFSGSGASYRHFKALLAAMQQLCWVEQVAGFNKQTDYGFGPSVPLYREGRASRFRATPALLQLATECGVTAGHADVHFGPRLPDLPIVLKGQSRRVRGQKLKGKPMPVPKNEPAVAQYAEQVRQINGFLAGVQIDGCTHRSFNRGFELGDTPDFRWDKGGRLYSVGEGNYQTLKKAQRLAITLDGLPVAEIDIRASYLTIMHAQCGVALDLSQDPYEVAGIPRSVVKAWLVASLGAGQALQRWTSVQVADYQEETGRVLSADYSAKTVAQAVLARFPVLKQLGGAGTGWADLMFRESEAVIGAMLRLQEQGIASLPVHDSLIVAKDHIGSARAALTEAFVESVGVAPMLVVSDNAGDIAPALQVQ